MNTKLNDIKKIAKTLSEHEVRINKLEQHNEVLTTRVNALCEGNYELNNTIRKLKSSQVASSSIASSEVIFSGIPLSLALNPSTAVTKVLKPIDASHQ